MRFDLMNGISMRFDLMNGISMLYLWHKSQQHVLNCSFACYSAFFSAGCYSSFQCNIYVAVYGYSCISRCKNIIFTNYSFFGDYFKHNSLAVMVF